MKRAFITGGNKGIGFEVAKQLLEKDFYVYIGCRDRRKGEEAVRQLKATVSDNVENIQIDVTDFQSIQRARLEIGRKTDVLDVLINNAGIGGEAQHTTEAGSDNFRRVYATNVFGVVDVTTSFMALLSGSDEPRIVNVSSNMGSLTLHSDPAYPAYDYKVLAAYSSSKAALNMYTVHLAYELRDTNFKVNAVCPGLTSTDFTGHRGEAVEEAGKRIVKYALIDNNGVTGKFFSEQLKTDTGEIPW